MTSFFRRSLTIFLLFTASGFARKTTWTFSDSSAPFAPVFGDAVLSYYDPISTAWGPALTTFDTASNLSLPLINGSDTGVMSFPAATEEQGYRITHNFAPNGSFEDDSLVSNYTIIMDVLFPDDPNASQRALVQPDPSNTSSEATLYLSGQLGNSIGVRSNYRGKILPNTWHRIAWVVRAAPGEGQAHRYIDGQFVGAIGTTNSGLGRPWALDSSLLLFTDSFAKTGNGFLSSLTIVDRQMSYEEIVALGKPSAAGTATPGPPAAPPATLLPRPITPLGHRGSSGNAPENTLAAINKAFSDGAAGTEIDIRLTSDNVIVAFHDATVDRTTDGTGEIANMTLAEVKELDAGAWFGPEFAGEKIPTLEEVLTASKGKGIILLDFKVFNILPQSFLPALENSQFPISDLWFWVQNSADAAFFIRQTIPGAQIVWDYPGEGWRTDPNFFAQFEQLGVVGFSFHQSFASLEFSVRAKAAGMFVEVYTPLDPEQFHAAAAAGVDFIETDFPTPALALQPTALIPASQPGPPSGTPDYRGPNVLTWIPGSNATSHRLHFGTSNPPPFIGEQNYDLFLTPTLEPETTYYWKVDEVTPDGIEAGAVWSFTTAPPLPPSEPALHEWHFIENLDAITGDALLSFAGTSSTLTTFETTNGVEVPNMPDGPTQLLRIPAFEDFTEGLLLTLPSTPANGGGSKINQYTFVFDILIPGPQDWMPFFNTSAFNSNDSDFFIRPSAALGIGALGYSDIEVIKPNTWHRVVYQADLSEGIVSYFVDGVRVHRSVNESLIDGRFALSSSASPGPHLRLFNDNDGETTEVLVGAVAFTDQTITEAEITELGPASSEGIFIRTITPPPTLALTPQPDQSQVLLSWQINGLKSYHLQSSPDLLTWTNVLNNLSSQDEQSSTSLPATPDLPRFFRLIESNL